MHEKPAADNRELIIGRDNFFSPERELEEQISQSRQAMDDLKEIIKTALFEVLAEVLKK